MVADSTAGWVTEKNTGPAFKHAGCGRDREKLVEQLPIDEYVLVRDLSTHWAPLNISKWLGKLSCCQALPREASLRCGESKAWAIALSGLGHPVACLQRGTCARRGVQAAHPLVDAVSCSKTQNAGKWLKRVAAPTEQRPTREAWV